MKLEYFAIGLGLFIVVVGSVLLRLILQQRARSSPKPDVQQLGEPLPISHSRTIKRKRSLLPAHGLDSDLSDPQLTDGGIYAQVHSHLERSFDGFAEGRLSLATFVAAVAAERRAIELHNSQLNSRVDGGAPQKSEIEDADRARQAVDWCAAWIDEQRAAPDPAD